ncbi:MAG: efflux RND transporter permease subunit [Myxococcota bacterium]|nr:efflux RND transporter permease subunit [Myxococcota bacterium]
MKGPIAWFAENHVAANLLMGVMVFGGLAALPQIPQKSFPDIDVNLVTVSVVYLGAAPEEVEEGVCIRIEEELEGIDGVERIQSTANEGRCTVSVELFENADEARALDDIKNRVDAISTFPAETEKPIIKLVSMQRTVMDIAITGPTDERELKVIGQRVRDEIAALPSVTQVELLNTRPYEVSIEVSEASLRRNGLSFEQVAAAVRSASLDLPGGSIKTDGGEILLRTKGQAYWGDEFEQLVVRTRIDGTRVLLRDVAKVIDGFEDTDQQVRFNGKRAAIIRVSRIGDQNILEITAALNGYLAAAPEQLPAGVELTIWSDGSLMLRDRLDTLLGSARQGFLMVLLLLALFLRPRLSFWVSVGVPASFLGAVWLIWVLGMSIDGISLFGFILVLGILVDDAIVIGESVYSHQQSEGSWLPAAIAGTRGVSVPVIFGVLTTVAAFTPLLLGPGTIGQIQSIIATVVMCCLLFSLLESQLVLPAHLGHRHAETPAAEVGLMLVPVLGVILLGIAWDVRSYVALAVGCASVIFAWHKSGGFDRFAAALIEFQSRFSGGLERFIHGRFRRAVRSAVDRRYTTAATAAFVLLATLGVLASGRLPFSFFPPLESDQVSAKLTMPLGTSANVTQDAVLQLEKSANEIAAVLADEADTLPPVTHILAAVGGHPVSNSGQGLPSGGGGANRGGHLGEVTMQLTPGQARDIETRDVAERWRELSGAVPDAVELTFETSLFSVGEAINIQLEGDELDELRGVAAEIREALAEYPGVIDIADSFRSGKRELELDILPSGEVLGLTLRDLARQVRQAFYGEEIQRIQRGRDDVRVMVRYTEAERRSLGALDDMRIRTVDGSEVPFATVARARLGRGFSSIKRSDGRRVVNVTADVNRTVTTADEVLARMRAGQIQSIMRDHPRVAYRLEGEQRQQGEAISGLIPLFGIALFIIFALLAIPLRSYSQPLIIMSVIPFALVGAVAGHLLMKSLGLITGLAMMSVMGFIAASGVVVNSSLVLVHAVNARRAAGTSLREAVTDAAVTRFRPVVLTSLTTFAGLLPLMINRSVQAQFLIPMAISLAFGVLLATVVTLLVVPSGYVILEDLRALRKKPRLGVAVVEDGRAA